jgi:60 kDa SS-A/Ro ribonucleoprotein
MNKSLFRSRPTKTPVTDMLNEAGGAAYKMSPKHALAQYAMTGCFNDTYYVSAEVQLDKVFELCGKVPADFVAKTAKYCREKGYMKDAPAFLLTYLSYQSPELFEKIFSDVINNFKMLSNIVQFARSGKFKNPRSASNKSCEHTTLPRVMRRSIAKWLNGRDPNRIFRDSIGGSPSIADVIKMLHLKPPTKVHEALYGYLIGKNVNAEYLPSLVKQYEDFKQKRTKEVPEVDFRMLDSLGLDVEGWKAIAKSAPWHMTRMNLNTFKRHGVLEDDEIVMIIAKRLADPEQIKKSRVFPYQLLSAYMNTSEVPMCIRNALQNAMEIAISNIPEVNGQVYVFPDVSGSMHTTVTGNSKTPSQVQCVHVAALVAAAFLRRNPETVVIPFDDSLHFVNINPLDSVMTNAQKLMIGGGGTDCELPLAYLNKHQKKGDLIVYISDNESWIKSDGFFGHNSTSMQLEWVNFKKNNPKAKMVCLDIQPYDSTQVIETPDVMNIGGFSDTVFNLVGDFTKGELNADHWVGVIEKVEL